MGRRETRNTLNRWIPTNIVNRWIIVMVAALMLAVCFPSALAYADECPSGGEHTYSAEITLYPTDDEDGLRHYVCTKCDYGLDKVIPAVGHSWIPWIVEVEPSCVNEGYEYRECNKQNDVTHREGRILAALSPTGDHVYELTSEVAATCIDIGHTTYTCSYCGGVRSNDISALGHEWAEWKVAAEAGPTEPGEMQRVCAHDATHVESEVIPATGKEEAPVEPEPPKDEGVPKSLSVVELVEPEVPAFYFQFTTFDAVFIALDLILVAIFFIVTIPLIAQFKFTQKKRAAARANRKNRAE